MLTYPREVLEKTAEHVNENPYAKRWLIDNNYEALVKLIDASIYRDSKAVEYLLRNKHFILVAFINAVWDDKKALTLLLEKKEVVWAAMANYINGDEGAGMFLKKNKLLTYAALAETIQAKIRKLNDKNSSFFNSGSFKV
jgi:hypothetical protein